MPNWNEIIIQALGDVKAEVTFTRGAILRNRIDEICAESNDDFGAYLKDSGQRFVEAVRQVPNVVIHRRPNTDMFIGFEGSEWPESISGETRGWQPSNVSRFRPDIYAAFTQVSDRRFWYFPDTDVFTQEIEVNNSRKKFELPELTLKDLTDQRRNFAFEQEKGPQDELLITIDRSSNPLARFQSAIKSNRLGESWHKFKSESLMKQIDDWAAEKGIDFRQSWLETEQRLENRQSLQQLMADFSSLMTDDEIRSISVPFRAVEALYRKINS